MSLVSTPDHVAVAVPSMDAAASRWRTDLGGGWASVRYPVGDDGAAPFATRQLRYVGGAKLELLEPVAPDGFAAHYLARFGPGIHHVTLKVPALLPAVQVLEAAGYDVVDVDTSGAYWHEGFLRPSQVGGMIVQVAWSGRTDEEWLASTGTQAEPPAPDGAELCGPTLVHPDLAAARRLWATLGGTVEQDGTDALLVRWPDAPLTVRVVRAAPGQPAGPAGLRFHGTRSLPADPVAGAAVLGEDRPAAG